MDKKVIKRNGQEVNFDEEKIRRVINLANNNKDVPDDKRMNEEQIEKVLRELKIDLQIRAEKLTLEQFAELSNLIETKIV